MNTYATCEFDLEGIVTSLKKFHESEIDLIAFTYEFQRPFDGGSDQPSVARGGAMTLPIVVSMRVSDPVNVPIFLNAMKTDASPTFSVKLYRGSGAHKDTFMIRSEHAKITNVSHGFDPDEEDGSFDLEVVLMKGFVKTIRPNPQNPDETTERVFEFGET